MIATAHYALIRVRVVCNSDDPFDGTLAELVALNDPDAIDDVVEWASTANIGETRRFDGWVGVFYNVTVTARTKHAIEVIVGGEPKCSAVSPGIFSEWTGRRYLDAVEHHAPVMHRDGTAYTGARRCDCAVCQEYVEPSCRPNATAVRGPRRSNR